MRPDRPNQSLEPPPLPPQAANTRAKNILAVACRYAVGIVLIAAAFIAYVARQDYRAPAQVSPDTAGVIGGVTVVGCYILGLILWYKYFKGKHGSAIGFVGFIVFAQNVGGFLARVLISTL